MIDHVSDTFVDPLLPLNRLVEEAAKGDSVAVEECSAQFVAHADKLAHVKNSFRIIIISRLIILFFR